MKWTREEKVAELKERAGEREKGGGGGREEGLW